MKRFLMVALLMSCAGLAKNEASMRTDAAELETAGSLWATGAGAPNQDAWPVKPPPWTHEMLIPAGPMP